MQSLRKVIIFGDSIPRGIRIHEFNSLVKKGYAKMKSFPGATSKELLHYVDPTLKDGIYNTAIIHVGVNDLLNNKSTNKVDELVKNLESTAIKCISNGIAKVVVSGIVMNNKMSDSFIGDVNKEIAMMCKKNSLVYMDNANIPKSCLFTDGLHLVEKGKCILANNFINILNCFFRDTPTPSNDTQTLAFTLNNLAPDLQILHDLRLKYPQNFFIGYLNINSLRNKIIDLREIISYLQLDYFVLSETKINDSYEPEGTEGTGMEWGEK